MVFTVIWFLHTFKWQSTWLRIPKNSASKTGLKRVRMSLCALILSPLLNWNIVGVKDGKCFEAQYEEYCCDGDDDDEDHLEGDIRVRHGRWCL